MQPRYILRETNILIMSACYVREYVTCNFSPLYRLLRLIFVKEEYHVLFVVRTESSYIMHINFSFRKVGYAFSVKVSQQRNIRILYIFVPWRDYNNLVSFICHIQSQLQLLRKRISACSYTEWHSDPPAFLQWKITFYDQDLRISLSFIIMKKTKIFSDSDIHKYLNKILVC